MLGGRIKIKQRRNQRKHKGASWKSKIFVIYLTLSLAFSQVDDCENGGWRDMGFYSPQGKIRGSIE